MEEDYLWENVFELLGGGEEKRQMNLQRLRVIEDEKKQNAVDTASQAKPPSKYKKKRSLAPRKKKSLASITKEAEKGKEQTEKALQELRENEQIAPQLVSPQKAWSWKKEDRLVKYLLKEVNICPLIFPFSPPPKNCLQ